MVKFDEWLKQDEREILETSEVPKETRIKLVEKLSQMNRSSGYFSRLMKDLGPMIEKAYLKNLSRPVSVLEIGCGGGGLLREISSWCIQNDVPVRLSGFEVDRDFADLAVNRLHQEDIPIAMYHEEQGNLGVFENKSFDIVVSNYVVHHIRGSQSVRLFLEHVDRIARSGYLVQDFNRSLRGIGYVVLGCFLGQPMLLTIDGIRSVRRAYSPSEIQSWLPDGAVCKSLAPWPHWRVLKED